mmetsp:Transcript_47767/g.35018  ORF Transcript_47767/g.35018 Transcript_47767/m.35018 type:complete len:103 (-) Transcript_47767:337-645(-)
MNIEYLRINIEDFGEVQINLSFPVAFNFIENAFNESRIKKRKTSNNLALVDSEDGLQSDRMYNKQQHLINSVAHLTPMEVNFPAKTITPKAKEEDEVAFQID